MPLQGVPVNASVAGVSWSAGCWEDGIRGRGSEHDGLGGDEEEACGGVRDNEFGAEERSPAFRAVRRVFSKKCGC
jgi:hypothetical protein